ncbi:MAG: hypothetical protein IKR64_02285 [Treponema sp.]|nr:hypothetical protein [Treponema sp.]
MNAVSGILNLQETFYKLPQIPLGLLQDFTAKVQIQEMFYGFGTGIQTTFGEFEGKTSA